jgi:hypothetical protein
MGPQFKLSIRRIEPWGIQWELVNRGVLMLFGNAANRAALASIKAAINGGMLCEKHSG